MTSPDMTSTARAMLCLRLFGPFDALLGGQPLLGLRAHQKATQLLALLALYANRTITNEWLATQLWPLTGSVDSLGHELKVIRTALGPHSDRLTAKAGTLCLTLDGPDVDVDSLAFDAAWENKADVAALRQGVNLYRGLLLEDWYDDWVAPLRNAYQQKYQRALLRLAERAMPAGDFAEVLGILRRLLACGEASSSLATQLLSGLIECGEYVEAKQLYEEYTAFLRQEHNIPPPARMTELCEQIPRTRSEFVPEFAPLEMEMEPVGGAVPLDSRFYMSRPADAVFHTAVARRDGIILLRGPRQVGKTSLLARGLEQARQAGARVVVTDFQKLDAEATKTLDAFLLTLARQIRKRLTVPVAPDDYWDPLDAPNANFEGYLRDEILEKTAVPVVWGIDEADSIFDRDYRSSVFGLFRSWYNGRSLDPEVPWRRFTLILTYSTETHLFIPNLHQSPFNVGTRIVLEDFTPEEVTALNDRYGCPLGDADLARLYELVGGHPFLVRSWLHEVKTHGLSFEALEGEAQGHLFAEHLSRLRLAIVQDPELLATVHGLLRGEPCPSQESYSRLRAAGVVAGDSVGNARLRCRLYEDYLETHLP